MDKIAVDETGMLIVGEETVKEKGAEIMGKKLRVDETVGRVKMIIEKAEKSDLQQILDLQYLAYQSEAKLFQDSDIPPLKQTLAEVESEYENGIILKAVDGNSIIIGSVRAHSDKGTVFIGKLMVHPEKQGQGIGTQLLLAIENEYPKQRYELFTSSKSKKNIELYERLGYRIFREEQITDELKFVYLEKNNCGK